jgi:hypothetical protein
MPLKRRVGKMRVSGELTATELAFLEDRPLPPDADFEADSQWWSMEVHDADPAFRPGRPSVSEMWRELGETITAEWAQDRPGRRPSSWWRFDAPEPRRRLKGCGEASWPDRLSRGLPTGWHWPVAIPGGQFSGGPAPCDPSDPPLFESEPAYLRRLGLLVDGEADRLTDVDYEPTHIKVPRHVGRR